jgi:hypothetical protein
MSRDRVRASPAIVTSNIVATLVVARWTGAIDLAHAKRLLGGRKARRAPMADAIPVPAMTRA